MEAMRHIQKAWATPMAAKVFEKILIDDSNTHTDTARLRVVATPHVGDWLHATPITAVGLRLSDEAIRIAVDFVLEAELASHVAAYVARWSTLKAFMACRAREVHRGRSNMRK